MENLDLAITSEILSRIAVESVLQCKLVCKTWRNLLSHIKVGLLISIGFVEVCKGIYNRDKNIQLYYGEYDELNIDKHYSFNKVFTKINHPPFENRFGNDIIVGSCNGLVCFSIPYLFVDDPVYICNPFTKEYCYLPCSVTISGRNVCGFGYDRLTDEYKVVKIYYPHKSPDDRRRSVGIVEVYTLGDSNGWRCTGKVHHALPESSPGILANGTLHWLDYEELKIVAFDLADEKVRLLPLPHCFPYANSVTFYKLQVLGGCLCVVYRERGGHLDIWSLKKKKKNSSYDVNEQEDHSWGWSREFRIKRECLDEDGDYEPFAFTKSNKVLLWNNGTILSCYDPQTGTLKKLMDDDMGIKYLNAIPHMNTSVSLKALGECSEYLKGGDIVTIERSFIPELFVKQHEEYSSETDDKSHFRYYISFSKSH